VLVVNQSMVDRTAKRTDIITLFVPGNEIAEETGDRRLLNMVMVGALLAAFPDIKLDEAKAALKAHLPAKHQKLIPNNYAAMDKGYAHAKAQMG
jgi:2-oxoglutarate ferredoxin oxidoreductase subunit gamma